ncbi:hypothetical protein HN51_026796 [Arachis hypogaea]
MADRNSCSDSSNGSNPSLSNNGGNDSNDSLDYRLFFHFPLRTLPLFSRSMSLSSLSRTHSFFTATTVYTDARQFSLYWRSIFLLFSHSLCLKFFHLDSMVRLEKRRWRRVE